MAAIVNGKNPLVVKGWTWGLNERHSEQAATIATDLGQLIRMADDILDGRMNFRGYDWPPNIIMTLIRNLNLPLEKACLLRKRTREYWCLFELVSRKDATAELLDECADEAGQYVVNSIVHHKNVMPETVAKITRNPDLNVVAVALTSRRLPKETLESFATSKVAVFRVSVACGSKKSKTLAKLAFDPDPSVRKAAVGRNILNATVREKVATTDNDIDVVIEATKKLTNSGVLKAVCGQLEKWPAKTKVQASQVEELKEAILKNRHVPKVVRLLIKL